MTPDSYGSRDTGPPAKKEGGPREETATQELPTAKLCNRPITCKLFAIHLADLCLVPVALSPDEVVESLEANTQGGEP
jgi:hypothetical protein